MSLETDTLNKVKTDDLNGIYAFLKDKGVFKKI